MYYFAFFLLRELLVPFSLLLSICFIYVKYSATNKLLTRDTSAKARQNILVITAHPDDECMFFTPTILSLLNAGHNIYLVCMSKGDFYGRGETRKKELIASCSVLGLPISHVTILDDERFQDGPENKWDVDSVGERILGVVKRTNVNAVITFDNQGVSGHSNHFALDSAVKKLKTTGKLIKVAVYSLVSTGLVRKYISFLDVPASSICNLTAFVCSPREILIGWKAMMMHKSQLVWFRWLYIVFSRYMYVNTLVEME